MQNVGSDYLAVPYSGAPPPGGVAPALNEIVAKGIRSRQIESGERDSIPYHMEGRWRN